MLEIFFGALVWIVPICIIIFVLAVITRLIGLGLHAIYKRIVYPIVGIKEERQFEPDFISRS